MALIYTKEAEKTLILAPREGMMRQFDFGDDWTEIRVGMFFGGVTSAGENTHASNESVALNSYMDRITFGIKSNTSDMPGVLGTNFIGILNTNQAECNGTNGLFGSSGFSINNGLASGHSVGTVFTANTPPGIQNYGMNWGTSTAGATTYCGFYSIKYVVANRGLSSQTVTLTRAAAGGVPGSDYSPTALRTRMNNDSYAAFGSALAWNDGAVAYDLPDCFWIRLPFYANRIRISCIRAIRYAP